jgi:hypothetical protein
LVVDHTRFPHAPNLIRQLLINHQCFDVEFGEHSLSMTSLKLASLSINSAFPIEMGPIQQRVGGKHPIREYAHEGACRGREISKETFLKFF